MSDSGAGAKHIYFAGIAGIGVSALAKYYLQKGWKVSGYDRQRSALVDELVAAGATVHYENAEQYIPEHLEMAVYSAALKDDHPVMQVLHTRQTRIIKRAECLGEITRNHPTLAVAGTHGKTTTSTIAAYLLRESGADPVAFLGGVSANYHSNYLSGDGEIAVVEADEYDRSFLHLRPDVAIITYIEPDHLDIYGSKEAFEQSFHDFVGCVNPDSGKIITKTAIAETLNSSIGSRTLITYGVEDEEADWSAWDVRFEEGWTVASVRFQGNSLERPLKMQVPGRHNIENALAALAATHTFGLSPERGLELLEHFRGVERRFERAGKFQNSEVIIDYAHHPTELRAAINTANAMFGSYQVVGIFEPHLYSRTRDFAEEFASALNDLQTVILMPLYPARELPIEGVSSMAIFSHIYVQDKYLADAIELPDILKLYDGKVLLFMGAGSIESLARNLVR